MENENDSELGGLVLEGQRGWIFYLSYVTSLVGMISGIYFFGFFWPNLPDRNKQNATKNLENLLSPFIAIFFALMLIVLLFVIWMSFRIYEKGVLFNRKTILFSEIKFFMYKPPSGPRNPGIVKFILADHSRKPIYIPLSSWGNEKEILELIRQEIGEKEVAFNFKTR
jgi:ATP/ADP translocase